MKKDVHAAALRAASKVAFSVAFIAGCSSAQEPEESSGQEVISAADASVCTDKKFGCADLVKAAFPTPGGYPGKEVTTSAEVKQCCSELLASAGGALANRWDCCANNAGGDPLKVGVACTPWGPPVPPSMKTARRVDARLEVA